MAAQLHVIGVNQHVACDDNAQLRGILLSTLAHTKEDILSKGGLLVCLGDFNAAPEGGRWGYSRHSKTRAADRLTSGWASQHTFREVLSEPLRATWKACLLDKKATLDRAWVSPMTLPTSSLLVQWTDSQPVFDHAMIMLRLPNTIAGLGYAGACRPLKPQAPPQGCRVNLRKFRNPEILKEWTRLLQLSLTAPVESNTIADQDPFLALKHGEMVADSLAYSLAPRRTRRPGDVRRSFGFAGHRNIFREINLLRRARGLVNLALQQSPGIMSCPHRNVLWRTTMYHLNRQLLRSCLPCPPALQQAERWYFTPAAKECLNQWMSEAKSAVDVRWASVRETFSKAQFENTKQLQEKFIRAGSISYNTDCIREASTQAAFVGAVRTSPARNQADCW